jgi:hypothetical protein
MDEKLVFHYWHRYPEARWVCMNAQGHWRTVETPFPSWQDGEWVTNGRYVKEEHYPDYNGKWTSGIIERPPVCEIFLQSRFVADRLREPKSGARQ